MKRILNFWTLLLTTLVGWLLTSCRETEIMVLYGPAPVVDTTGYVVCKYGVAPPETKAPVLLDEPADSSDSVASSSN